MLTDTFNILCRLFRKAGFLTRPTPTRQDAPFRGQGRSFGLTHVLRFTPHVSRLLGAKRERRWRTFSTAC